MGKKRKRHVDAIVEVKSPNDKPDVTCYKCQGKGYFVKFCREKKVRKEKPVRANIMCFKCKEAGHFLSDCPQTTKRRIDSPVRKSDDCYYCKKPGHEAKHCPKRPRGKRAPKRGVLGVMCGGSHTLTFGGTSKVHNWVRCFKCKRRGHKGTECYKATEWTYPKEYHAPEEATPEKVVKENVVKENVVKEKVVKEKVANVRRPRCFMCNHKHPEDECPLKWRLSMW